MVSELSLRSYLDKFDRKYWATYKVLDILQKVTPGRPGVDGRQHLGLSRLHSCPRCHAPCSIAPAPRAPLTRATAVQVFYRSNPAREAFVEMCESDYVQKMTFDSYLYKTVVPGNPLDDVRLLVQTVGSLLRGNALRQGAKSVSFGSRAAAEEKVAA